MDINTANEVRAEGLREDFYQAVKNADWGEVRTVLKDMELMSIDTYNLRREMNDAMNEEANDFDAMKAAENKDSERETAESDSLSSQAESYGGAY